jgi:hypothetical protein
MSPNTSSHMWLRLLFKVFFIRKCIKIIFKKKIIFDISTSKWFENIKKNINLKQKKIYIFQKRF